MIDINIEILAELKKMNSRAERQADYVAPTPTSSINTDLVDTPDIVDVVPKTKKRTEKEIISSATIQGTPPVGTKIVKTVNGWEYL